VPQGMNFIADVNFTPDGAIQLVRLQP